MPTHSAQAFTSTQRVLKNIIYCTVDGADFKLDIYRPDARSAVRPAPAVVYVHGGIWSYNSKRDISSNLDINQLNRNGFLVASIDFRLAPKYKFPAMIEDVKTAVRYLRANAEAYHLNPDKIAALGISSGAHLAALLGLAGAEAGFDVGAYPGVSSQVQAVVDVAGPVDLVGEADTPFKIWVVSRVFGSANIRDPMVSKASPMAYVASKAPPFLILHGRKDKNVPLAASQKLQEKLKAAGGIAELVVIEDAGHNLKPRRAEITQTIVDFLIRTLTP